MRDNYRILLSRASFVENETKCVSRENGDEISDSRFHGSGTSRGPMNPA